MADANHLYAIAIGSNRPHGRHGVPAGVVTSAIATLDQRFTLFDASPLILNPATGGAGREFANAVAIIASDLDPRALLAALKSIERDFGRRPGRRWGPRVLDLDIVAWSGGTVSSRTLTIPHPRLTQRAFVVAPLAAIAADWRIIGSLTARHLSARLARAVPRR